jgi:hypothetical protein
MKFFRYALIVGLPIFPKIGIAENIPAMSVYLEQKMQSMEAAVCSLSEEAPERQKGNMVFQDINLQLIPTVTFGINSVLHLSIAPEIDFVLTPKK